MKPRLLLLLSATLQAQSVNIWLTTDDQKSLLQPQPQIAFQSTLSTAIPTIFIDEQKRYQSIEGFGAAMTDSSAYLIKEKIPSASLPAVMTSLFDHSTGIGVSFLRNPMGASDLSRTFYSFEDQPNAAFSIAHDQTDIIPLIRQAKSINPKLKIMANPWSPPGWMKTSGSMIGGSLLPSDYQPFANYFVQYLQAYAAAGIAVDYISLQNEPLYVPTAYPGMSMPASDQLTVLRDYLLPALTANKLTTKVLIYDHNWDQPPYPETILSDPTIAASTQIAGTAWHWYAGTPGAMSLIHNQYPTRANHVTEASGGTWVTDEIKTDFETITQCMRNWSSSYVKWGLALDENHGPFIPGGCETCNPLITVNETSGAVGYNVDYYTLGHFSKIVLPGAVRIYSNNAPRLITAAFTNPDSTVALIAYNDSTQPQTFQVASKGKTFTYTLQSLAGASFLWSTRNEIRRTSYTVNATQQIQASSYTDMAGVETEVTSDTDGGYDLAYATDGSWAEYQNLDLTSVSSVNIRAANAGQPAALDFHLDSQTGPLVGTVSVPATGGWQTWTTVSTPITATGLHNLFLVFRGTTNLNWFQFH